MTSPSKFVAEGGKFHLAEALFNAFRYKIRCPSCAGNPTRPGFIKDEGGKGGKEGQKRRQWKCQRSNGRSAKSSCSRATCTEYIDLAKQQLDHAQFDNVLQRVCQKFPPDHEDYATLQGYLNAGLGRPGRSLLLEPRPVLPAIFNRPEGQPATTPDPPRPAAASKKRKADEELPFRDKAAGHAQAQQRREQSDTSHLRDALPHLKALAEIGRTCEDDYRKLSLFLASSSPAQCTPSCTTPSWSSPDPPSVFSDALPSDATIACTDTEDTVSSSPPEPSSSPAKFDQSSSILEGPLKLHSPIRVYVTGASVPSMFSTSSPVPTSSKPLPCPSTASSSRTIPDPVSLAKELAQQFNNARVDPTTVKEKRQAIRKEARVNGVYINFQRFLNTTELKRSDHK